MAAAWRDKIGRVMDVRNILGRARSPRLGGWPLRRVKHGNRIGTGATRRGPGAAGAGRNFNEVLRKCYEH